MKEKSRYLTISEFSKISDMSRKALIFYDNIGLFSPEYVADNGYRYYSHEQVYLIFVINILKELGMPLNKIKTYVQDCTPTDAVALLEHQGTLIAEKIEQLQGVQDMLFSKLQNLKQGIGLADTDIRLVHQEEKPIFSSDPFSKKKLDIFDEEWVGFYLKCRQSGIAFGYPEGFMVCKDRLKAGQTDMANRIICHVGDSRYANDRMPKGNYVTACGHGSFQDTDPIYARLLHYIHKNQLEIAGNAYEIRLIDEVASKDAQIQLMQVYIQVK